MKCDDKKAKINKKQQKSACVASRVCVWHVRRGASGWRGCCATTLTVMLLFRAFPLCVVFVVVVVAKFYALFRL